MAPSGGLKAKLSEVAYMKNLKHQTKLGSNSSQPTLFYVACSMTGVLLLTAIISGIILSSSILVSPSTHASNSESSNVSVIVNSACTITTGGGNYARIATPGTVQQITGNGINVTCNDSNGYALYAVGYSTGSMDPSSSADNTKMLAASGVNYIATGTSGTDSYWSMRVTGSSDIGTAPTIDNGFDNSHVIPDTVTKISHYGGTTLGATANSVTTPTYEVYVATTQPVSTYTGKVKYTLVHPNDVPVSQYMQNWNGCSSLAIGSETFLVDNRDNKVYNIVKFNDGRCWMTTNLDLTGGTQLSNLNTDMPAGYTLPTANGFQENNKLPESSTEGFSNDTMAYLYNSNNQSNDCSGSGCYSYYSWTTATLGSGLSITGSGDAPYSICPAGWHLPTLTDHRNLMVTLGGSAGIDTYNNNTSPTGAEMFSRLSGSPLHYLRTGYYLGGSFSSGGFGGLYWSATSYSSTYARNLYFYSTYVGAADYSYRRFGSGVRCILDQ